MYGFISIENTVIVFGAGDIGVLRDALSHLSQVLLGVSRSASQTIRSSKPLVVTAGSKPSPPNFLFFFLNLSIQYEDAGILSDTARASRTGLPSTFLLFPELFSLLFFEFLMPLLSHLCKESLLVEVDRVSEA